jgi:hypothetical protein
LSSCFPGCCSLGNRSKKDFGPVASKRPREFTAGYSGTLRRDSRAPVTGTRNAAFHTIPQPGRKCWSFVLTNHIELHLVFRIQDFCGAFGDGGPVFDEQPQ